MSLYLKNVHDKTILPLLFRIYSDNLDKICPPARSRHWISLCTAPTGCFESKNGVISTEVMFCLFDVDMPNAINSVSRYGTLPLYSQ